MIFYLSTRCRGKQRRTWTSNMTDWCDMSYTKCVRVAESQQESMAADLLWRTWHPQWQWPWLQWWHIKSLQITWFLLRKVQSITLSVLCKVVNFLRRIFSGEIGSLMLLSVLFLLLLRSSPKMFLPLLDCFLYNCGRSTWLEFVSGEASLDQPPATNTY